MPSRLLETLTWREAEKLLNADRVVVIPLGASCKEHGPHLPLNNDWLLAEYFKKRMLETVDDIVVAPTVGFSYYPSFVEFPGSITLRVETARDVIVDICTSLAAFGARKFYVLNTAISTIQALEPARQQIAQNGISLRYCEHERLLQPVRHLIQQERGSHADEVETSIMLHIAPHVVDFSAAVKDNNPGTGKLNRREGMEDGIYSASGVWGDPTLATAEKGKIFAEAMTAGLREEIEQFKLLNVGALSQ